MGDERTSPFETIEGTQEFMLLLDQSIEEALAEVREDLAGAIGDGAERRAQALQLAVYNLNRLSVHVRKSQRILNDLRTLRRLLFAEREADKVAAALITQAGE